MYKSNGRVLSTLFVIALLLALGMTATIPQVAVANGDPKDTIVIPPDSSGASPAFNPYGVANSDGGDRASGDITIDLTITVVQIGLKSLLTWGIIVH